MAKAKVLLVEDDPVQASATRDLLERLGYEVLLATDGVSAIKSVKSTPIDIILLDVILPGLDGYEVCRWLKLDEGSRGIPVIMLTIKKDLTDKISGLQIGADDYLPKPYNEHELNARIYASLRTKALQDELRMKNRQLEELLYKVEYMAITDALTDLYNRRKFHEVLANEFERSKRYSTPFSLVLLDIDHFKRINDRYGHLVGDSVLRDVAKILVDTIRDIDTASRYGGEEFTIVLPSTPMKEGYVVAERIRKNIESHKFPDMDGEVITASIGLSGMPDQLIVDQDKMVRCADLALYRAKQTGRNRTEMLTGEVLKTD